MLKSNKTQSHLPKIDVFLQYSLTKWLDVYYFFIIFIFIYSILLAKCYTFAQVIVVLLVWEIYLFFIVMILSLFYLIIWWGIGIATSHIWGNNSNSCIFVGEDYKPSTNINIPTHTRVCLEVNTRTETLDFFMNDEHIKDRVVNVPKDMYFGVWFFISSLFLFVDTDIVKERFNSNLTQSSLFYLILFYFFIIKSTTFNYHNFNTYIYILAINVKSLKNILTQISVEVDMNKFLFLFVFLSLSFFFPFLFIFFLFFS
jgi:hypothetical protein